MKVARISLVFCVVAACAAGHYATVDPGHPAFVVPHHVAEGKGEGSDAPLDADGGARQPLPPPAPPPEAPALSGSSPDPVPLSMAEQWQFQLLFQNGAPSVEQVQKQVLSKPISTPRRMGRFALELWIGRELIDRVRFDFPLIAAEETPGITRRPLHDAPSMVPHAIARIRVSLPASPRATRLVLVDRATEKVQELPWPPDRDTLPPTSSAAASAPSAPAVTTPPKPSAK